MKKRSLTTEQELEIVALYKSGEHYAVIADRFGIGIQTVYNALNRQKISRIVTTKHSNAQKIIKMCSRGASIREAAAAIGVSESTVDRVLRNARPRGVEVPLHSGRPRLDRIPFSFRKKREIALIDQEEVGRIYNVLRKHPFPYPEQIDDGRFAQDLLALSRAPIHLTRGDTIGPKSIAGLRICNGYFPHRFEAISRSKMSAVEAWHDEKILKQAISFQLSRGDPVAPKNVLRAVTLSCRTPTIFRPTVARFIYTTYCSPGDRVWDPCSGYGGRLLGAFSARVQYTATDVDSKTVEGNKKLAERLGAAFDVIECPAEAFDPPKVKLVFTSPPYFTRERYSQSHNQSWKKHGETLATWLEGFLRPVIVRAHRALAEHGHLILNIADIRERKETIPLVAETINLAIESGFVHVQTLRMPLAAINRIDPFEPVLVFRPR